MTTDLEMLRDFRHGVRLLRAAPGFAMLAILTVALGIALDTAMFTVVNALLLKPLPYRDARQIVVIWNTWPQKSFPRLPLFNAQLTDLKRNGHFFSELAGYKLANSNLTGGGEPERLDGVRASASFFPLLGVSPALGRTFTPQEDQPGSDRVVVLSYGLWQRRFAGDPNIVGRTITMDGVNRTVIGVMPAQFRLSLTVMLDKLISPPVEFWIPLAMTTDEKESWGSVSVYTFGRLKPSVTTQEVQIEVSNLRSALFKANDLDLGMGNRIAPLPNEIRGDLTEPLWILFAAVTCVLLIACANLAGLLLARGASRIREIGIRMAIGASRTAVMRQLVTEAVLISIMGGIVGTLASQWLARLFVLIGPAELRNLSSFDTDHRVLIFAFTLSVITGLLFGVGPAWQLSKADVTDVLVDSGRTFTGGRRSEILRNLIVVGQVACTAVVLAAAILLTRSLMRVLSNDPGFGWYNILTAELPLSPSRYPDAVKQSAFFEQVLQRVQGLPGVLAAAVVETAPFAQAPERFIQIEDEPVNHVGRLPLATTRFASPDYLKVTGIPLRAGRWLNVDDRRGRPGVAVADQMFVNAHWPHSNPIGKHIRIGGGSTGPWMTIVGVVGATRQYGLDSDPRPGLYLSYLQDCRSKMSLMVRTAGEPLTLAASVRSAVRMVDPDQPVAEMRTLDELIRRSVSNRTFEAALFGTFACCSLLLATLGVFSLLSWFVAQRVREIGVRIALGATPQNVLYLMLRRAALLIGLGLLIGSTGALVATRLLQSFLFGVTAADPVSFAAAILALFAAGVLASALPAWRALRVDPVAALRAE